MPVDAPIIEVWNKIDLVAPDVVGELVRTASRLERVTIPVSAATGEGLPALFDAIDRRLGRGDHEVGLTLRPDEGRLLAWIHGNAHVISRESDDEGNIHVRLRVSEEKRGQLTRETKLSARRTRPT
jgi:GTP-binding protein HflX